MLSPKPPKYRVKYSLILFIDIAYNDKIIDNNFPTNVEYTFHYLSKTDDIPNMGELLSPTAHNYCINNKRNEFKLLAQTMPKWFFNSNIYKYIDGIRSGKGSYDNSHIEHAKIFG